MAPKKNKPMPIGAFLQDETLGSWADEMEDMPLPSTGSRTTYSSERRDFSSNSGMSAYQDRGYSVREELPLPSKPPYTAHLGNMSFETTQADVTDFFRDCEVTNVRIVEDKLDRKPKGFGYVEFATVDGLKKALTYAGTRLQGREIRVSVADPPKDREGGREITDWTRKGPLADLPSSSRRVSERPGFQGRSFDNMSDAGSERGGRRPYEQADGKTRDFSNWERRGPLSPQVSAAPSLVEGGRQGSRDGGFRKASPSWGEGRSQEGSRPPRREFQERPVVERPATAADMDNQWRSKMRPDAPAEPSTTSRETSTPSSPAPVAAAPATRPKLNLAKRTVSEAEPTATAAASTDSKASPFGAARPVDTLAREKEIEEKRQLAIRLKKEAEEKAKAEKAEEKRLAKEAADAKAKASAEEVPKEIVKEDAAAEAKENGGETPQPGKNFEILRRASEGVDDMLAPEEGEDEEEEEGAEGAIVEDKAVKPKAIARDPPKTQANGAWRKKSAASEQLSEKGETANLEEDGWSTVSKPAKQRNNRRGKQGARAIAS